MISYIRLRNFLSHGNIEFNLEKTQKEVKKFAAIYGENGSGKTNFINSVMFLSESIRSFEKLEMLNKLKEELQISENNTDNNEILMKKITDYILGESFKSLLKSSKTIDCDEIAAVEYGFEINGRKGEYKIAFDDSIIEESLRYFTGKQTGNVFTITKNKTGIKCKFSSTLFKSDDVEKECTKLLEKYWGNHTFLSIVRNRRKEQNESYIKGNYNEHFLDVISYLSKIGYVTNEKDGIRITLTTGEKDIIPHIVSGEINKKHIADLKRTETVLYNILTQSYADIKNVAYKISENGTKIEYELFIDKIIAGKVRRISADKESRGTRQILMMLPPMLAAVNGATVFIDEADTSIHDILFKNILNVIRSEITGQLVITTHNTLLLEEIPYSEAYVIAVNYNGEKEAICIDEYDIQKNNNARKLYLNGLFGGVPTLDEIDSSSIIDDMNADYSNVGEDVEDA